MAVLLAVAMVVAAQIEPDFAPTPEPTVEEPTVEVVEEEPTPAYTSPREYLYMTYPALARRLDCMIRLESSWIWGASGARGRYIGLAQFDLATWYETPQGQAGLSRYDPYASIDALAWGVRNLGYGRWPVTSRRC